MKKIIYYLVIMIGFANIAYAKDNKIVVDKQVGDTRVVEAQGITIGGVMATKILHIGLQMWVSPQDTSLVLVTNVNTLQRLEAFDNSIMLIKTMDDKVIELRSVTSDNNSQKIQYASPTITTTVWKNRISSAYRSTSAYHSNSVNVIRSINYWYITREIINELSKGIKKIKIQYKNGTYEKDFKKDNIGSMLHNSYIAEKKYMMIDKDESFREGF